MPASRHPRDAIETILRPNNIYYVCVSHRLLVWPKPRLLESSIIPETLRNAWRNWGPMMHVSGWKGIRLLTCSSAQGCAAGILPPPQNTNITPCSPKDTQTTRQASTNPTCQWLLANRDGSKFAITTTNDMGALDML